MPLASAAGAPKAKLPARSPPTKSPPTTARPPARDSKTVASKVGGPPHSRSIDRLVRGFTPALSPTQRSPAGKLPEGTNLPGPVAGSPQAMTAAEMRFYIAQMKRETGEIKSAETKLKTHMRRAEADCKRNERDLEQKAKLAHDKVEAETMTEYVKQQTKMQKTVDLDASREYQEAKRLIAEVEKATELQNISDHYAETKEDSEYRLEQLKLKLAEQQRQPIEANLEKCRHVAEYKLEKARLEDFEEQDVRRMRVHADLFQKMTEAEEDRNRAAQDLDYFRAYQNVPIARGNHLTASAK